MPDWLALYLEEDLGSGDITSTSVLEPATPGSARIVAREGCVLAGGEAAAEVFARVGATVHAWYPDGCEVAAGTVTHDVSGPAIAILAGERLALNILARMSGIATVTRSLMHELARACSGATVAGTRKTTPGFRWFEKEAIRIGGGEPHRMSLGDEAMVKDNHREAVGSVAEAVRRVRRRHPDKVVSAEVESLQDALAAADAGAHWILIDNQPPETGEAWAKAVWGRHPGVKVEASGGIRPETIARYGWADRISLGWLTQKVPAKDFGLDWGSAS
ncbi:MAG TPA: carboxylating nicotinate-nucleotide diphosphorylase [Candidatus Thermoplasmatota archaeon]|nr:carboxylating nicotinate-nucleotide diphosphorylase [Candidatus Thermoplasmatota archaeon]